MALDRGGRLFYRLVQLDPEDERVLVEATQAPIGTLLALRYLPRRLLSQSNHAVVIEALDVVLGKRVAMKFVTHWRLDDQVYCARMRREGSVLARVRHPNIVRGLRVGRDERVGWYVVMELLGERSLARLVSRSGPPTMGTAVRIIRGVLAGLAALHDAGIVHLDLKHENVLLVPGKSEEIPKLIDFDFILLPGEREDPFCELGMIPGTPGYLAPEQARGLPLDHRTNVHGAALLLYELLSGDQAYAGDSLEQLRSCAFGQVRPIRELRPNVPAALEGLLERALHENPAERPETARAFRDALLEFADPDPPQPAG